MTEENRLFSTHPEGVVFFNLTFEHTAPNSSSVRLQPGNYNLAVLAEANKAIMEELRTHLKEVTVCPVCERKFHRNAQKYQPTRQMVEVMFEMARVMNNDPRQRKYVKMVERPELLPLDERIIGMTAGIKQNHKMRLMNLISFIDSKGNLCSRSTPHVLAAYTITQRGWDLLNGLPITPWQIHVQNSKVVLLDEDKGTVGSITDVRDFTYDEWIERGRAIGLPLKIPN